MVWRADDMRVQADIRQGQDLLNDDCTQMSGEDSAKYA